MVIDRTHNRSDAYQDKLLEISSDHESICKYIDSSKSHNNLLNPTDRAKLKEELLDLHEELREIFWEMVKELTPRQQDVLKYTAEGFTQVEVAKMLGVNQSSITKSIHGNCDYRNGKKVYGGGKKKLLTLAEESKDFKRIFSRMAEINEELD